MFSPLNVELTPSRIYRVLSLSTHVLAGVTVLSAGFDLFVMSILLLCLLVSFLSVIRFPINRGVRAIGFGPEAGDLWLLTPRNQQVGVQSVSVTFQCRFLILISVEPGMPIPKQWILLLPDMVSPESWRKLQVLTRWAPLVKSS